MNTATYPCGRAKSVIDGLNAITYLCREQQYHLFFS